MPQAFKNILPALCNEYIVLFKETAIAGVVAVADLTRAANRVIGVTFQSTFPLLGIALIYLIFVMIFTMLAGRLERRLKSSER
jgi:ABC-type amino acid transport system permease subunit